MEGRGVHRTRWEERGEERFYDTQRHNKRNERLDGRGHEAKQETTSISVEEKVKFFGLGKDMLEIYDRLDQNGSLRKIIVAAHDKKRENMLIFFQGNEEGAHALRKFLNERPK